METVPLSDAKARLSETGHDASDSYGIVLTPGARRALTDVLPEAAAFAAWELISGALAEAPHRVGTPLRAPFAEQWRARRGEYRVRYDVEDETPTVRILDIGHRRDAYGP